MSQAKDDKIVMENNKETNSELYVVLKNHEEQYCIWPAYKEIPLAWSKEGKPQPKSSCLEYIRKVWTDMRPLSLRNSSKPVNKGLNENASAKKDKSKIKKNKS